MKKTIVTYLAFIMTILICFPVSALAESDEENRYETSVLQVNGKRIMISDELSDNDVELLLRLLNEIPTLEPKGVVCEIQHTEKVFWEDNLAVVSTEKNTGDQKSIISPSVLNIYAIKSDLSSSTQAIYDISSVAVWSTTPYVQMADLFALSWAGDFAVINYSANAYWKSGNTGIPVSALLHSVTPNRGLAYQYYPGTNDGITSFSPWYIQINVRLSRALTSGYNTANVVSAYAHRTNTMGNISVSFGLGSVSFSASLGATYDTAVPHVLNIAY